MDENRSLSETDKQAIEASAVFKGLSPDEIAPILDATQVRIGQAGQVIMSSGARGDGIYVILEGQASVFLPQVITDDLTEKAELEDKIELATLTRGACFGEYSLVDQKEISATVQATTQVRLGYLPTPVFHDVIGTHIKTESMIYKNLLEILVSRCRSANMELDMGSAIA